MKDWRDGALDTYREENKKLWKDLEGENIEVRELVTGMKDACHKIARRMQKGHNIHIEETRDLFYIELWCKMFIWECRKDPMDLASELGTTADKRNDELWRDKAEQRREESSRVTQLI